MKNISLLFIILIFSTACSHKNDLKPDRNFIKSIKAKNKNPKSLSQNKSTIPYRSITYSNTKVRKDALVVGVGEYKNNVQTLYGVEKDLKNINRFLHYINVNSVTTLADRQATLNAVKREFYKYIHSKNNSKENIFIFYYSGHGVQVVDINGDEADNKDEATALYDFQIDNHTITKGVLLDDELSNLLAQIKSKKILIFDKCHSGSSHRDYSPFVKSINGDYRLSSKFLKSINLKNSPKRLKNFIIFSATKDNQRAEDSPEGGLFTKSFIDGILNKKADTNRDKKITIVELKRFCKKHIHSLAKSISKKYKVTLKGTAEPLFIYSHSLNRSIASIFDLDN